MLCPRRGEVPAHFRVPDQDDWRADRGFDTCSFCGSMKPEKFIEAAFAGRTLTPTDKSYKVYVDLPEMSHAKFYFQHLPQENMQSFIDMYNAKKLVFAYPGYFYTLPFFMVLKK